MRRPLDIARTLAPVAATSDRPLYVAEPDVLAAIVGFDAHRGAFSLIRRPPAAAISELAGSADRLATQGERTSQEAIDAHLELAREMVGEALAWRREGPPRPPIRGDRLASELGIEPGPELGRLLGEIEAAVFAGEVSSPEEAIALARKLV